MKAFFVVDHLDYFLDQKYLLSQVSFSLQKQQLLLIKGASGTGKTTLLKLLMGYLPPKKGSVFFEQQDICNFSAREKLYYWNQQTGFIDQFHRLLPEFTVAENVALPYWIAHSKQIKMPAQVDVLLDYFGIIDQKNKIPAQLSGGQQQRVAIARALINQPSLVFADEPAGNLDVENATKIYVLFEKMSHDFGTSFLMVSHDPQWQSKTALSFELKEGKIHAI